MQNKFISRKFIAWIIWTLCIMAAFIFMQNVVPIMIPWYGGITIIYIGGQAVVDGIKKD